MGIKGSGSSAVYFETQPPIDYLDTTLVINTWETVSANLSGGRPARLIYIILEQTNNGASAEDIELELTINGTAYTWTGTLTSGTQYYGLININLTAGDFTTELYGTGPRQVLCLDVDQSGPFHAATVGLIRVRQTTGVDVTSAQIEVNIVWEKLVGL